jgi:hypothetical protein
MSTILAGPKQNDHDRGDAVRLFLLALVTYAWFFPGGGFNQNASFDMTRAIVEEGRFAIDSFAGNTGDVSHARGHLYPNKAPGLSILAAVPYAVIYHLGLAGGSGMESPFGRTIAAWMTSVSVVAVFGAAIPAVIFLHLRDGGTGRRRSLAAALIAGFATPLFAYSTMFFAHVPSAALTLAAFHLLFRRRWPPRPALAGFLLGVATAVNYLCGPLLVIFMIGLLAKMRWSLRAPLLMTAGALPPIALLAWWQWAIFGSPFRTPMSTMNPAFVTEGAWLGIVRGPELAALWGITFSPYRGLFFIAPVMLLAGAGALRWYREGRRIELAVLAAATLFFFAFNASFNGWHGGYTIGPRYLLPIVPLLVLLLPAALERMRAVALLLAMVSLLFNFAVTAVDPQPPDRLTNPIFQYSLPALVAGQALPSEQAPWLADWFTGHASVNRQTVDEMLPFQIYPPGSAPAEWASFNLGELVFPVGSFLSLVPIILWIVGGSAWLLRVGATERTEGD